MTNHGDNTFFFIFYFIFNMNIFVAKLNYRTTSEQLREVFESFGEVKSAKVVTDFETGRSKGFGFVEMAEDSAAHAAINNLDNTELHESTIVVKEARPKEERNNYQSRGGYGGGGGGGGGFNNNRRDNNYRGGGGYNNRDNNNY